MSVSHKLFLFVVMANLVLAPSHAPAQTGWPPRIEDPVLAALIEEAHANNPDLRAARQATEAAAQRPAQARALPNPMISVGYQNDGWSPSLGSRDASNLAVMATQTLPYFGKRTLRGDLAQRGAEQAGQQAARIERGLTAAVKNNYYGLLLSRELQELIREQAAAWQQIESVARARYAVGLAAQQDVLRVQVEVTRAEQLLAEQEGEADLRTAELNRLLNRAPTASVETPARLKLRPSAGSLDEVATWASTVSPELKGADLGVQRASLSLALARKEFRPDFSVQTAYMNRGGLAPMWQVGFGISVPAYRKRLFAGLAEAESDLRSQESRVESLRVQLRSRTRQRLIRIRTTERLATLYEEGIVPQDRMSVEAAIANYETGKVPFIAVLEALTTLYNDQSRYFRLLAGHEQTLASLEEAGLGPDASDLASGMPPPGGGMATAGPGGMDR